MVERTEPLGERALGVSGDLGQAARELHSLWYIELRATEKELGWGHRSYIRSDMLLVRAGRILLETKDREDMHNFARAYGRLSMGLPYIAYHTINAIIMLYGVED